LRQTKLQLEPQTTIEELRNLETLLQGLNMMDGLRVKNNIYFMNDVPRHLTKSPEDIVADYLTRVTEHGGIICEAEEEIFSSNILWMLS
jgi:hypothetical protein